MDAEAVDSSPGGSTSQKSRLLLPASCGPPEPAAPRKQLVWVVSFSLPFDAKMHSGRLSDISCLNYDVLVDL